ncbi:hypothetical protein G647_04757 [Cladophialophora carrionii CBS 160.54]|uniref:Glycosyltransferase family 25 protein n=1 Tax=Cladophialophora carrionii CBS 160.54 TaxID=1279043 RepID=V9DAH5_9EURO|nr:uncharacterized protein G647_04757 [Cladophialophora carrionii CBS 160.54]ETI22962.1 hypothetical protein G647_04757 [Cladophialophora carrionii CBS 160.54]
MLRQLGTFRVHANPRLHILPAAIILLLVFILLPNRYSSNVRLGQLFGVSAVLPRQAAANATLGFQKLIALSSKPSWRTRGLQAAANLTGLDFIIPPQPHNPEEFVVAFEDIGLGQTTTPKHGSASAWVAHLDLLKFVIASGFETTFIVEDDVDWDVRIKDQIKLISDNVRNYTSVPESDPNPYGTDWDVLWLGHCGSAIDDWIPPGVIYADDTRIPIELYASWSTGFLQERLPQGHRIIHASTMTVCSFGYGVTRASAQKILTLLGRGADEAFDVALSHQCRERALRCLVVNPQIMHHYEPSKDLGYVSPVDSGDGEGEPADETNFEFIKGKTLNIVKSARCQALFNDTCV